LFSLAPTLPSVRVMACLKGYVVVDPATLPEGQEGLCLVDQRAAHSRVIFEELRERKDEVALQTLLIPYTVEVTPLEAAVLRENLEPLNAMGIQIQEFGNETFIIQALPEVFGNTDLRGFITDVVHCLREYQDASALEKEREKRIALAATTASMPVGQRLSFDQAKGLVDRLMRCQSPYQCPLGTATMVVVGPDEIAKRFQR